MEEIHGDVSKEICMKSLDAVKDALYAVNGKWKLPIIIALSEGPRRFKELQRALDDITPKMLSKELKEMELNEFITRTVYDTTPVTVEYALTPYSGSLKEVILSLRDWGIEHKKHLQSKCRERKKPAHAQVAAKVEVA
ncbi:winged helix-turn-helix transcriptional regulator [Deminuibacter soli]|uniref:Transcriptional regulator n=1 Tax=Deminuibacter soli TaxID=2291815 RepID=A0A3E1NS08_9BACT|nr:helix-turn-helix domain-containing protein [Deminuibacter soli]RFM30624.1 transcriptional regulator [Deminuibacter soli]